MSRRTVYFLTNGIRTWPGSEKNWNGRGVTHIHTSEAWRRDFQELGRPPGRYVAEKIEYYCTALGRAFFQAKRAEKLFRTASFYKGFSHVHVGHSNGADVILRMMRDYNFPAVEHLHLVCGATEADFDKNGLNSYLRTGKVRHVTVYVATRDMALRLASWRLARMLGYGVLGLHGPRKVAPENHGKVSVVRFHKWGHSECWADQNFEQTMNLFLPSNAEKLKAQ